MSYNDSLDGVQREINRDGERLKKMKKNRVNTKLNQLINKDEQMKINKSHEGYCYGCAGMDQTLSSLWFACTDCSQKRGKEGLMAIACKKYAEEFCDFCAKWKLGVCQVNVSMCEHCRWKVDKAHKKYHETGGRNGAPFHKFMVNKYGKDYQKQMGAGVRTLGI